MRSWNDRLHARLGARGWQLAACVALAFVLRVAADDETFATATPEATIRTLHEGLVDVSAEQQNATLEQRYEALRPLITATHDLPYIAQFTIRRQWPELEQAEQQRFVDAFERLSIMTYASRFSGVSESSFKLVRSAEPASGRAEVEAAIVRSDADDVPLEYLLQQRGNEWKIINIIADGVSDLALKRAEYQRVLAQGSIADLIEHIEDQAARLR